MEWRTPMAFLLFLPLFFLCLWFVLRRKTHQAFLQFSSAKSLKHIPKGLRAFFSPLPFLLKVLTFIFLILALARPQKTNFKSSRNIEGIDILLVLDISQSMLIEDMPPSTNRLEASKKTIKEFIQGRISDRMGLLVFSGESYTRVPLTLDYPLLQDNLSKVQPSRSLEVGTAIGVALANAVGRLKDSTSKTRVVIFLTDGENNSGIIDPETALDAAKGYGIKIYSIGMGKDGEGKVPFFIQGPRGQKIKRYHSLHSQVNEKLLKKMANQTKGKYYRSSSLKSLENVFRDINKLEKSKMEIHQYKEYEELFPYYLKWALVFYLPSPLFSVKPF